MLAYARVLHDRFLCGMWRLEQDCASGRATLVVTHVKHLFMRAQAAVAAEGRRLLRVVAAASEHETRLVAVAG